MSNLRKIRAKEKFLSGIEGVDREDVLNVLKDNDDNLDLYSYFVTLNAHNTERLDDKEVGEFIHKMYSDWYFLAKNLGKDIRTIKLFNNYRYSPIGISEKECFSLIQSEEFMGLLPIKIEYTNKLEDKYFVSVDVAKLYYNNEKLVNDCRLYLNIPSKNIIPFVKEFLDRCYLNTIPCNIKFFCSDERSDDVIIYCDYEYAQKIVDLIEEFKSDYSLNFANIGEVNPLLAKVNDYIGFGEQPNKGTYFSTRSKAISNIQKVATGKILKDLLVGIEERNIYKKDGTSFTPTEYMAYMIERIALVIIDEKILKLESLDEKMSLDNELEILYRLRENITSKINIASEVNKLKKSITRKENYTLQIEGIGKSDYVFVEKLYNLFTTVEEKYLLKKSGKDKRQVVANRVFNTTENFEGVDTYEYLYKIFKKELAVALDKIVEEGLDETKYARQSSILNNLKMQKCIRLKAIIKAILDDSDDGKELVDSCIKDYLRILACDSFDNVEIIVEDETIKLDSDVSSAIKNEFENIKLDVYNLTINSEFVDNMFARYDINPSNFSLRLNTKSNCKIRQKGNITRKERFYYSPEESYVENI